MTTDVATKVTTADVLATIDTSASPINGVIAEKLSTEFERLAEISKQVGSSGESDPNAPKKPTIGAVIKEAGILAEDDSELSAELEAYNKAKAASKAAYRSLFTRLHPEFASVVDEDEVDDSEKKELVEEAKAIWKSVKAGIEYLSDQDGVPAEFQKNILAVVPTVEGARMITTVAGEVKRPKFESIVITLGDAQFTAKTFTDAATTLVKNGRKGTVQSDIAEQYYAAGGNDIEKGDKLSFSVDDFEFEVVKG